MKIGILFTVNEYTVDPASLARKMEALGFESLWIPEHAIIPVNAATPLPESPPGQGRIPEVYSHICDPFIAMSLAGAVTTRLKLATGVMLVPERNPIVAAKEIATLDYFSGGRVMLGIGAGWLKEESEILGVDFAHRWSQTREYVAAMRELWTKPEPSFSGKYIKFPPVRMYPKPAQPDGPPILIGSKDKNALRWVVRWGDGWCPIFLAPPVLRGELGKLRGECESVGRDFSRLDITIMKRELRGDRASVQSGLHEYEDAGAHRFVIMQIGTRMTATTYEAELERLAALYV
ncbi:MAG TPA: LLM class F420-dependent oxidoreductase [Candidatus Binataceae bacterium]|nr:LLM class F420-dependent oxidoreductase [Candidatus Binataceae bacterium]